MIPAGRAGQATFHPGTPGVPGDRPCPAGDVDRAGEVYSQIAMLRGHLRGTLRSAAAEYRMGVDEVLVVLAMSGRRSIGAGRLAALTGLSRSEASSRLWTFAGEGVVERGEASPECGQGEAAWRLTELGEVLGGSVSGPDLWRDAASDLRVLPGPEVERLIEALEELSRRLELPARGDAARDIEQLEPDLERARRLAVVVERLYRTVRAEHSRHLSADSGGVIDSAAYMVLDLGRRTRMSAVAACQTLGVNHGRLMEISEPLVRRGYLVRRRSPHDVREVTIETTVAGHEAIEALQPFSSHAALVRALVDHPDPDDLSRRLDAVVRRLGPGELVAQTLCRQLAPDGPGARVQAPPAPSLAAPADLRAVMGEFATGVALVTASTPGGGRAVTVNSLTSVSLEPVLVLVCLVRERPAVFAIQEAGAFGINVLPVGQEELAGRFGRAERPGNSHSLDGIPWTPDEGIPRIGSAIAWLGCSLERLVDAGDHVIVLGAPMRAEVAVTAPAGDDPLIFWRGGYGSLDHDRASAG